MLRHMRSAAGTPHHCAFLPQLGANHPLGYFSFGTRCSRCDGHVVSSVVAARQMAAAMGYRPAQGESAVQRRLVAAEEARDAALARVAELEQVLGSVEALKASGVFVQARKPGRPKKTERVTA